MRFDDNILRLEDWVLRISVKVMRQNGNILWLGGKVRVDGLVEQVY